MNVVMPQLFGTDGIRGIANKPPLDPTTVVRFGQCLVRFQKSRGLDQRTLLARDTRISGLMLEAALVAGICSEGGEPMLAGVLPTPALARMASHVGCEGVVISASHNPWPYNGIKFVGADGFKWSAREEEDFEALVRDVGQDLGAPTGSELGGRVGSPQPLPHAAEWYVNSLLQALDGAGSLSGLTIAVDCANGAAVPVAVQLFQACGADVTTIGVAPDGYNINDNCGSLFPEQLRNTVLELGSDAGVAFDGDADRVALVDERGSVLDGDQLLWILARDLDERGALKRRVVVGTVMSNFGLERALARRGIQLLRTSVGDRFVVEQMREVQAQLGGEPSGHIVWLDHATTGDGLLTALAVLQIAVARQRPVSELCSGLELFPQVQVNVEVPNPRQTLADDAVQRVVEAARQALQGVGRLVVRASGTEPVIRILLEGENPSALQLWSERIASQVRLASGKAD